MSAIRDHIIATTTGIGVGTILLLLSIGLISLHERKSQAQVVKQITKFQHQVVQDVGLALTSLNSLKTNACDTSNHVCDAAGFVHLSFSQTDWFFAKQPINLHHFPRFIRRTHCAKRATDI